MSDRHYTATGFGPIDEEHQAISEALATVVEAMRTGEAPAVAPALLAVQQAVAAHFAHEERLMAEHGYPKAARHREAHGLFLADVAKKVGALPRAGLTDDLRRWIMGRLVEWFRFHIMTHDVELGRFLVTRLAAQAAPGPAAAIELDVEVVIEVAGAP